MQCTKEEWMAAPLGYYRRLCREAGESLTVVDGNGKTVLFMFSPTPKLDTCCDEARADERAKAVEYLRSLDARKPGKFDFVAEMIERGEHDK